MEGEQDDYYNFDEIETEKGCGGVYDNGLNPDCQPCDVTWCEDNCDISCSGDQFCQIHPECGEKCPCPLYTKKDLNISVSCGTSQSVMDYDFSEFFSKFNNRSLDENELSVSISLQVVLFTLFHF